MSYNQEDLEILYSKFDNDMKKRTRLMRFALSVDQMINVVWLNGSQDETCSSHIGRKIKAGTATKFQIFVCRVLRKIETSHCYKSRGE